MDANKLILKIFEKGLNVDVATDLYKKICYNGQVTIADAIKLKELLDLTDLDAIDIFLA